jgi:ABC-type glycerol-3-phosphate transport system substrate-binding protein
MADSIVRNLQRVYLGQASPDAGMKDAASQINEVIEKN